MVTHLIKPWTARWLKVKMQASFATETINLPLILGTPWQKRNPTLLTSTHAHKHMDMQACECSKKQATFIYTMEYYSFA